jgi:histidinol-phosphate aminotransferase
MKPKSSIRNIPIYQPGKPIEEVKREYGLSEVIKLASNENPYGCSSQVWESLTNIKDQLQYYPEDTAPELTEKLAEHLEIDPRRLIFGNGSDEVIQMICRTYLEPGCESIMAEHTFSRYEANVRIEGATVVKVPMTDGTHDLEAMAAAITERTKVIWICNPNNPTGTFVTHQALADFLDQVPEHVLVVLDEAYYEYVIDESYPDSLSLLDYNPQLIVLRTFSKIYGLASFRIGYGVAHPDVLKNLHSVREPFNTNRLAQMAALAALEDQSFVYSCRRQNRAALKQMEEFLDQRGYHYYPSQTNFLLFDTGFPAEEAFTYLLERGIVTRRGDQLGFPTYLRVNTGTEEQTTRFIEELNEFLQRKRALLS